MTAENETTDCLLEGLCDAMRDIECPVQLSPLLMGCKQELVRLREAKRMAGLIADERSKENVALRAALTDILLLDGKQLTARQKYAHAATLSERALGTHEQRGRT